MKCLASWWSNLYSKQDIGSATQIFCLVISPKHLCLKVCKPFILTVGLMHISAVNSSANILQWKYHTTGANLIIFHINNSYSKQKIIKTQKGNTQMFNVDVRELLAKSFLLSTNIYWATTLFQVSWCLYIFSMKQTRLFSSWSCQSSGNIRPPSLTYK